ncbi:hypothetical protein DXG01_000393 [Tephrocybe rancida]|nr:hypothetical protein DXG01_000393 [Tephrocybe rancida]
MGGMHNDGMTMANQSGGTAAMNTETPSASGSSAVHHGQSAFAAFADAQLPVPLPTKRRRRAPAHLVGGDFMLTDPELQDFLPVPLLPAMVDMVDKSGTDRQGGTSDEDAQINPSGVGHLHVSDTPANIFGIFQRFVLPTNGLNAGAIDSFAPHGHDPNSQMSLLAMSDVLLNTNGEASNNPYAPFPNKTAFLLANWFWNGGIQKSKDSFRQLLSIIGHPEFSPLDISSTNWQQIDQQLGVNAWDIDEWEDQDAGWGQSSVHISVPFHRNTENPGRQDYTKQGFYHRLITSIIREKLTMKKDDAPYFHLEPYELLWKPHADEEPTERYTLPQPSFVLTKNCKNYLLNLAALFPASSYPSCSGLMPLI